MPYPGVSESDTSKIERCVARVMSTGKDKSAAIAICHSAIVGGKAEAIKAVIDAGFILEDDEKEEVAKSISAKTIELWSGMKMKVIGDWKLKVLGNPFGPDADIQWFDARTKIVSGSEIPVIYYHSLTEDSNPKKIDFAEEPIVIGKAYNPQMEADGTWWEVILDKTAEKAKEVWEAAQKGLAVASSGCIDYLSRLEIDGKLIPYTKRKPGRIAIWHMGELSLWDKPGHLPQAHPNAHAIPVPALKAIYEAAKMPFPPSLVSPKNAETDKVRKGELEELRKSAEEIERFLNLLD